MSDGGKVSLRLVRKKGTHKRIIVHIVLFALAGAFFLNLGIMGRRQLKAEAERLKTAGNIEIVQKDGMELIRNELLALSKGDAEKKQINQAFNSQKRSVKKLVAAMMAEEKALQEVFSAILDKYVQGIAFSDADETERLKQAALQSLAGLVDAVEEKLSAAEEQYSLEKAKIKLPASTKNYAIMYYNGGLIGIGASMLLFAGVLTLLFFLCDDDKKNALTNALEPFDYLAPFFIGVLVFTVYPVIRVIIMSFQERYKQDGSFQAWGFGNYSYVLKGIAGTTNVFMQGMRNTLLYVLYTVPASTVIAVVIAYLLNQKLKFSALFQTSYFLPMVTSITAVGLVWRWIFNMDFGLLNAIINLFGGAKTDWLMNPKNSMAVMVIFGIWNSLPFTIILLLSGLQNIDETYYTVARVDGAKAFRIFRRITVPLLAPTIGLVLTINSISAFKIFTSVQVLFNGTPGPARNMYTVVYYIFEMMRESLELGRAAAAAIILFICIFVFTMLQRFIQRKWNYQ